MEKAGGQPTKNTLLKVHGYILERVREKKKRRNVCVSAMV